MCVCVCVHMHVHVCVRMHVPVCVYAPGHLFIYTNVHIYNAFTAPNPKPTEKMVGPHNEGDSLLRTLVTGRMVREKTRGKPKMMLLD